MGTIVVAMGAISRGCVVAGGRDGEKGCECDLLTGRRDQIKFQADRVYEFTYEGFHDYAGVDRVTQDLIQENESDRICRCLIYWKNLLIKGTDDGVEESEVLLMEG